jgi:hypothetical protein
LVVTVSATLLRVRIAAIRAALARGDQGAAMLALERLDVDVDDDHGDEPLILWAKA